MRTAILSCNPWDLIHEGPDAVLDRIAHDVGCQAVSVGAVLPGQTCFRPHPGVEPRWFRAEPGVHFQPSMAHYAETRLKPTASDWLKSKNPLDLVARAAESRRLPLWARVVCCHAPGLAARQPWAACKDVFGGVSRRWLCPCNPDVGAYAAALVNDLATNYPLAAIEVGAAGFDADIAIGDAESVGLSRGPVEGFLLSLCFCESCRQWATGRGVDAVAAQRSVEVNMERALQGGSPLAGSPLTLLSRDSVLAAFAGARAAAVTERIETMVTAARGVPVWIEPPSDPLSAGFDVATVAGLAAGLSVRRAVGSADRPEARLRELCSVAGGAERVCVGIDCHPPTMPDGATLVRAVHELSEQSFRTFRFSDYGTAPEPCLDWLRQAIRYSRRESGEAPRG